MIPNKRIVIKKPSSSMVICAAGEGICKRECLHAKPHHRKKACRMECRQPNGIPSAICVRVSTNKTGRLAL